MDKKLMEKKNKVMEIEKRRWLNELCEEAIIFSLVVFVSDVVSIPISLFFFFFYTEIFGNRLGFVTHTHNIDKWSYS